MARYLGPKVKLRQKFGLAAAGETRRRQNQRPKKRSDYGERLLQKQKLKFIYGIMERQMQRYAREAFKSSGEAPVVLMQRLETRLDNIVYRLGLGRTREQARQLVTHGHILVDGKKLDIPSYKVEPGQTIAFKPKTAKKNRIVEEIKNNRQAGVALGHLQLDESGGRLLHLPKPADLPQDVDIAQVLEFYHNIV